MPQRAQFAIEMFFAFTFAILLVFWLVNYLNIFSDTTERVPVEMQQKVVARELARLVNLACSNGPNLSEGAKGLMVEIEAPCIRTKQESWYYNISNSSNTLVIKNEVTGSTSAINTSCILETIANLTRCVQNERLCIYKVGSGREQRVRIVTGRCA